MAGYDGRNEPLSWHRARPRPRPEVHAPFLCRSVKFLWLTGMFLCKFDRLALTGSVERSLCPDCSVSEKTRSGPAKDQCPVGLNTRRLTHTAGSFRSRVQCAL